MGYQEEEEEKSHRNRKSKTNWYSMLRDCIVYVILRGVMTTMRYVSTTCKASASVLQLA